MEINTITTILIAIAPAISAVITVVLGFIALIKSLRTIHKNNVDTVIQSQIKLQNVEKKINTVNSKLASIEKFLEDKRR